MTQVVPVCPAILSVIGWHAGQTPHHIVQRKSADIKKAGCTIWLYQSWKARIQDVQTFGNLHANPTVYFLEGAAYPASTAHAASQMSSDGSKWQPLPNGIGPVTGKLPGGGFFLGDLLDVFDRNIDLWEYVEHPSLVPLKFQQGASTACAVPSPKGAVSGMKSRHRRVVAIGKLIPPYAVYLK